MCGLLNCMFFFVCSLVLKQFNILEQLSAYAKDAKNAKAREGAMFAFDRLFFELGSKFEPYVVQILPHLLACFGDASTDVREATQDAARYVLLSVCVVRSCSSDIEPHSLFVCDMCAVM
jgi:hypothetical protein